MPNQSLLSKEALIRILDSLDKLAWAAPGYDALAALWRNYGDEIRKAVHGKD